MGVGDADCRWDGCHGDVWALSDDGERERAVTLIGKPAQITASAVLSAVPAWNDWLAEMGAVIAAAGDESSAVLALMQWQQRAQSDERIAASLYTSSLQADAAGQLFVRAVEVKDTPRSLADNATPSFLSLPFDEAIRAFLARRIITPEQFRELSDLARTRAFTATQLASMNLIERAQRMLRQTLEQGGTLREFATAMSAGEIDMGVQPSSPWYLETVYRTNVQAAYGAGRYRQITSTDVRSVFPFVEYRTTRDNRVRQSHAALDLAVFSQDDPNWPQYAPPNGFNCRCVVVPRRADEIDRTRLVSAGSVIDDEGAAVTPDAGFAAPPGGG